MNEKQAAGRVKSLIKHYNLKGEKVPPRKWLESERAAGGAYPVPKRNMNEGARRIFYNVTAKSKEPFIHERGGTFERIPEEVLRARDVAIKHQVEDLAGNAVGASPEKLDLLKKVVDKKVQQYWDATTAGRAKDEKELAALQKDREDWAEALNALAEWQPEKDPEGIFYRLMNSRMDQRYLAQLAKERGVSIEDLPYANQRDGKRLARLFSEFDKASKAAPGEETDLYTVLQELRDAGNTDVWFRGSGKDRSEMNKHMWTTANPFNALGYARKGGSFFVMPATTEEAQRYAFDRATAHIATLDPIETFGARIAARDARLNGRETVERRGYGKSGWGDANDYELVVDKDKWPLFLGDAKAYTVKGPDLDFGDAGYDWIAHGAKPFKNSMQEEAAKQIKLVPDTSRNISAEQRRELARLSDFTDTYGLESKNEHVFGGGLFHPVTRRFAPVAAPQNSRSLQRSLQDGMHFDGILPPGSAVMIK